MANTYKALSTVTVGAGGAATIAFTNIPQTYTDLVIRMSGRSTTTDVDMFFTFNSNTSNYTRRVLRGTGSNASSTTNNDNYATTIDGSGETSNTFANLEMYIPNYASSNFKAYSIDDVFENNSTTAYQYLLGGSWSNTSPATSLTFYFLSGGTFAQYTTATLYGVFNADVSSAPATPTIGSATAGNAQASITFTGVSNAASYTMTSTPGSITATGTSSPITVTGLTNETAYTFKVKSNNPFGSSAESAASNSVTPSGAAFESIATATVGAGGTQTITFSGIPQTYTHLQIRGISTCGRTDGDDNYILRFNDAASSNYANHRLFASGSALAVGASSSQNRINLDFAISSTWIGTNNYAPIILDILDYTNTNKYKTVRYYTGFDSNGGNRDRLSAASGLWQDTSAISTITLTADANQTLSQYTTLALYGIKAV